MSGAWTPLAAEAPVPDGACRWCGRRFDARATVARGRVRCAGCGSWTTWPPPTPAQLGAAYGDWYRPAEGRFGGPGDALLRATRGALARRIDAAAPPGRVLDVGAGDGTLLRALAARGRNALGLERATATNLLGMSGHGPTKVGSVEVRDAAIHELPSGERFAAVVFWHALEHLPDPAGALRAAAERLVPGGLLIVAVPNAGSEQAARIGAQWLAWDLPRHLTHVTAAALRDRLTELGLAVTHESHLRGGQVVFGWLHGLTAKATGADLYDAIRRPAARQQALTPRRRALALAVAAALAPVAAALALGEARSRRGGTVFLLARSQAG